MQFKPCYCGNNYAGMFRDHICTGLSLAMCVAASGRMQLKKKTPTRPSIQQLQGSMSAMGLQDSNTR